MPLKHFLAIKTYTYSLKELDKKKDHLIKKFEVNIY